MHEHEMIYAAIAAHDVDGAMRAMAAHMHMTRQQYDGHAVQVAATRRKRART